MKDQDMDAEATDREAKATSEREWRQQRLETERQEIAESTRLFDESEAYAAKQRGETKKKSAADRSFTEACEFAKGAIKSDGLNGEIRPYSEIRYTVAQGLKATVHGREDGIAALVLQRTILVRLDSIKSMLWAIAALLTFIAYKVT